MAFGTVVVRIVLLGVVPVLVSLVGGDPGPAVILLSVLAAVFECAVYALNDTSSNGKRGGKKEKSLRPLKSFPLQLAVLYIVQLWFLLLRTAASSPAATDSASPQTDYAAADAHPPVQPLAATQLDAGLPHLGQVGAPASGLLAPTPTPVVHPDRPRPWARTIEEGFQLDASPEELKWFPKTISVVLPCAEERDLAFKTVRSVFEQTPADILHEIVVVDDGSNPPLSQTHLNAEVQHKYKVKIERHEQTVGLIGAKKTGGDAATGDIVVFFDCHVGPQPRWHEDFMRLIGENYRRMVVPQITALDINSWTQIGGGGGMSKCYVTWDGDFKWGGTDDMYMGMLSGGLAGLSKRWWTESGGYDSNMLGWGGENIDQGIRMWVCGGEIVAAPNSQVAHMWRTGAKGTNARYRHVGDTGKNRARAMHAWMGEFTEKLNDFPQFAQRKMSGGDHWFGDMSTFQNVKNNLQGCRPFAWYLRRFKTVYEDAGMLPKEIFMIKEEKSGDCLLFQGQAGTSGSGREGVVLAPCDQGNHRFYWHPGNRSPKTGKCCSGLRAWNTEQCLEGGQSGGKKAVTGICEIGGRNSGQFWRLHSDGSLKRGNTCLGPGNGPRSLKEAPCFSFRNQGGAKFVKMNAHEPIETTLYNKARKEHPDIFAKLDAQLKVSEGRGPKRCQEPGIKCVNLMYGGPSGRCLDDEGNLNDDPDTCSIAYINGRTIRRAEGDDCLDTKSDEDPESFTWYHCHGGNNQNFDERAGKYCASQSVASGDQCFDIRNWP